MNDEEAFDLAKGIFTGMDLSTEIGYQNACNNILNSYMEPWQKDIALSQIHSKYIYNKNLIEQGKRVTDFVKLIYDICHNK